VLRCFRTTSGGLLATAAVGLLWMPAPSPAWGPLGHQAVGAVADARLAPATRSEVERLLAADVGRDGAPSGRTTLAQVSTWADEIRGSDSDHPRWHYDNMPVCRAAPPSPDWCALGECASARVEGLLAVLADRRRPLRDRNEALKWVVHLVGDLHQPLHAADYAQGATQVPVELEGRRDGRALTLHGAWDVRLADAALHAKIGQPLAPTSIRSPDTTRHRFMRRRRAGWPNPTRWRGPSRSTIRASDAAMVPMPRSGCRARISSGPSA
jgi:hypothetical protein